MRRPFRAWKMTGREQDDVDGMSTAVGEPVADVVVVELADVDEVREDQVDRQADDEEDGGDALEQPGPHAAAVRSRRSRLSTTSPPCRRR